MEVVSDSRLWWHHCRVQRWWTGTSLVAEVGVTCGVALDMDVWCDVGIHSGNIWWTARMSSSVSGANRLKISRKKEK